MSKVTAKAVHEIIELTTELTSSQIQSLLDGGWTTESLLEGVQNGLSTYSDFTTLPLWEQRLLKEKEPWGSAPSETVKLAHKRLPMNGTVAEFGFGYGRDLVWLAQRRKRLAGVELSQVGFSSTYKRLCQLPGRKKPGRAPLEGISLVRASIGFGVLGQLAGAYSHRMLHLLDPKTQLPQAVQSMVRSVNLDGFLVIGARSYHDYDASAESLENVVYDKDGLPLKAEYNSPDRPGHILHYYSPRRFLNAFWPYCEITELWHGKELESVDAKNSDGTERFCHFITAVMRVVAHTRNDEPFLQSKLPILQEFPSVSENNASGLRD